MKYEIPSVVVFGSAAELVQGDGKGPSFSDNVGGFPTATPSAYQADE